MRGRTIHQRRYTYHTCRPAEAHGPRAQELWPDHPKSVAVREDYLLDGILDFFARTIFHPQRHQRLADQLATVDTRTLRAAGRQRAALQRTIDDLDARARRLVRALELNTALDGDRGGGAAFAEVHGRLAELQRQREATERDLAALDDQQQPTDTGAVELLDALPVGTIALQGAPDPTLRRLFAAFHSRSATTSTQTGRPCGSPCRRTAWMSCWRLPWRSPTPNSRRPTATGPMTAPHLPMRCRCRA